MAAGTSANISKIRRNNDGLISGIGSGIRSGVFGMGLRDILRDIQEPAGPQIGTDQQISSSFVGNLDPNNLSASSTGLGPGLDMNLQRFSTGTPMDERTDLRGGFIGDIKPFQEATGAPGEPTQFSDGSEGYRVNRFGGFAGPTGGGTLKAGMAVGNVPVSTLENFSPEAQTAAQGIFGTQSQRQMGFVKPRQLITF
tara:strand:- start:256 stop:846 length:591 start_codon:yes stop_codon:yes gene_type:complete